MAIPGEVDNGLGTMHLLTRAMSVDQNLKFQGSLMAHNPASLSRYLSSALASQPITTGDRLRHLVPRSPGRPLGQVRPPNLDTCPK